MLVNAELISEPIGSIYEFNSWAYGALSYGKPASEVSKRKDKQRSVRSQLTDSLLDTLPDFIFHLQMFNRSIPEEALLEFANLESNNTPQALDYLQRYGILD